MELQSRWWWWFSEEVADTGCGSASGTGPDGAGGKGGGGAGDFPGGPASQTVTAGTANTGGRWWRSWIGPVPAGICGATWWFRYC